MTNVTHHHSPVEERLDLGRLGFPLLLPVIVGLVSGLVCLFWQLENPRQFAFSWLFAFTCCFTVCGGALFWVLLHHAVDANWSVVVRRPLETMAALFPFLALAFVPVLMHAPRLFSWMTVLPAEDELLAHKAPYLNVPFFMVRAVIYFVLLSGFAVMLRRYSLRQDLTGDPLLSLRMRKISYAGIPCFALSLTFAAFDWLMGLDYRWFSTMWGVYLFAGSALSSMAAIILVTRWLQGLGFLRSAVTVEHYHIMGKLLFTFIVFWGYIAFSQYFLIYYANVPEETFFFIRRNEGSWHTVSLALVIGHFIVPFLFLLTQPNKRSPKRLSLVAGWILLMHVVDIYWIVMPSMQFKGSAIHAAGAGFHPHPLDFFCLATLVGLLGYVFIRLLGRHSLLPIHDPRLAESIHLKN